MNPSAPAQPLLRVDALACHFKTPAGTVRAVDGVSFELQAGQTLGIVGESGCGKTTTARMLLRLESPTAGSIRFEGEPVEQARGAALAAYRRRVQAVFQDPYGSLNPRMRVGDIIGEPLVIAGQSAAQAAPQVAAMMRRVGLDPDAADRYPHEFSGGQRQRIAIARGLILQPSLLVLDEPVSALDVSIRGQVLNLLLDLQDELGLSYVLISHDLEVVFHVCHTVAVMYLGQVVESGPAEVVAARPSHPYTQLLLASRLVPQPGAHPFQPARRAIPIDLPSPLETPPGCRFSTRCPQAMPVCSQRAPQPVALEGGHRVACHLWAEPAPSTA